MEEIAAGYVVALAKVIEALKPVLNQDVYADTFDIGEVHFYVAGQRTEMTLVNHDEELWVRIGTEEAE